MTGRLVGSLACARGRADDVGRACVRALSPLLAGDAASVWDYASSVEQYAAAGGTAESSVRAQVRHLRAWMTNVSLAPPQSP